MFGKYFCCIVVGATLVVSSLFCVTPAYSQEDEKHLTVEKGKNPGEQIFTIYCEREFANRNEAREIVKNLAKKLSQEQKGKMVPVIIAYQIQILAKPKAPKAEPDTGKLNEEQKKPPSGPTKLQSNTKEGSSKTEKNNEDDF